MYNGTVHVYLVEQTGKENGEAAVRAIRRALAEAGTDAITHFGECLSDPGALLEKLGKERRPRAAVLSGRDIYIFSEEDTRRHVGPALAGAAETCADSWAAIMENAGAAKAMEGPGTTAARLPGAR